MGEILVSSAKAAALRGRCNRRRSFSHRRRDNPRSPVPDCPRGPPRRLHLVMARHRFSTMSLNAQDIARIANLARLELKREESARMLAPINAFSAIVEKMRAVDTSGVEPLPHPVAAVQEVAL